MANGSENPYIVPNLVKALQMIELLAKHADGLTLPEMVQQLEVPKTSLFRIANTLSEYNYLIREEDTNRFRLSRKFLRLGLAGVGEESLIEKALNPMRVLRDTVNETVLLGTLMDKEVALLEQVIGNHPFTFFLKPGKHFNVHASSPGKAILAFLPKEEQQSIVERADFVAFNERTITDKAVYIKHLEEVREKGYAVDHAEEMEGVHCIGAPIFNQHHFPIAAIWTTGPSSRLKAEDFDKIGAEVIACANKISHSLGCYL